MAISGMELVKLLITIQKSFMLDITRAQLTHRSYLLGEKIYILLVSGQRARRF